MFRPTALLLAALLTACGATERSSDSNDNTSRTSADSDDVCAQIIAECEAMVAEYGAPEDFSCEEAIECEDLSGNSDDLPADPYDMSCESMYEACVTDAEAYDFDAAICDDFLAECQAYEDGDFDDGWEDCPEDHEGNGGWGEFEGESPEELCDWLQTECFTSAQEYGEDPAQCEGLYEVCLTEMTGGWDDEPGSEDPWGEFPPITEDECVDLFTECVTASEEYGVEPSECEAFLEECLFAVSGAPNQGGL